MIHRMHEFENCAVIVAHPDDETLWCGGSILLHPEGKWTIISLTRKSDAERAEKFSKAVVELGAKGIMGDMDDGPEQADLSEKQVQKQILDLLPMNHKFDVIITHCTWGEYTRHKRHEEIGKSALTLFRMGELPTKQLWTFAYEDGGKKYLPKPVLDADILTRLPDDLWQRKYDIITKTYGFAPDSFEAKTTPRKESFWCFNRK